MVTCDGSDEADVNNRIEALRNAYYLHAGWWSRSPYTKLEQRFDLLERLGWHETDWFCDDRRFVVSL